MLCVCLRSLPNPYQPPPIINFPKRKPPPKITSFQKVIRKHAHALGFFVLSKENAIANLQCV